MKVFLVVESMGEGAVLGFSSLDDAKAHAAASDGTVLSASVPQLSELPGTPDKVWVIICGDRGCVTGYVGAFLDKDSAVQAAANMAAYDAFGLSYEAHELVVSGPALGKGVAGVEYRDSAAVEHGPATPSSAKGAAKLPTVAEKTGEPPTPSKADSAVEDREGAFTGPALAGAEVEPPTPSKGDADADVDAA